MNTHRSALVLMFSLALLASERASADQALATSKACMACHTVDKKVVGPAFKDVARKYAGNKEAQSILANKISRAAAACGGLRPCHQTLS